MAPRLIDLGWRREHPLPSVSAGEDKNSRGRLLLVGGSAAVPGGVLLTGEAALRAGAAKVRIATIARAAIPIGVAFAECAVEALPETDDGEIDAAAADILAKSVRRCDTLLIGPAMTCHDGVEPMLRAILDEPGDEMALLLDAGALPCTGALTDRLAGFSGRVVLTPHYGEMAALTGLDADAIAAGPERVALDWAARLGAVIALKGARTVVAAPDGTLLEYRGDCPGLGTSGSGDVLAGVIGGLIARGASALDATGWGVWLHGEAGQAATLRHGPIGIRARDLIDVIPSLLAAHASC